MSREQELLEHAKSVLASGRRDPSPAQLVEMRRAIDGAITTPERSSFGFRWLMAGAAAAACCTAAILVARIDEGTPAVQVVAGNAVSREGTLSMPKGSIVEVGRARLLAARDARIHVPVLRPEEVRIDLASGEVELDVDPSAQTILVTTPLAEIRVLGTRFTVAADEDRTEVRVSRGSVAVKDLQSDELTRVTAGQKHSIERTREVAAVDGTDGVRSDEELGIERTDEALRAREVDAIDGHRAGDDSRPIGKRRARERIRDQSDRPVEPALADEQVRTKEEASAGKERRVDLERALADEALRAKEEGRAIEDRRANDERRAEEEHRAQAERRAAEQRASEEPGGRKGADDVTPAIPPRLPPMPEAIRDLLRRADAHRRTRELKAAAALYGKIAEHPEGGPFAEEALFREAELSARLGHLQDGLRALAEADRRFGRGELAPERSALAARIHLGRGDAKAAARALDQVPGDRATLEVAMAALDVAKALEPDRPCEALHMSRLVHKPEELRARAEELAQRVRSRCEK